MLRASDLTKAELLQVMEILDVTAGHYLGRALSQIEMQRNDALRERERQRWIPVTERLPVGDDQVLVVASGKPLENIELVHAVEIASLYSDGWCLEAWPEWTGGECHPLDAAAGSAGGGKQVKAVLISIKPKWCKKIMDGEKTIELRKTKPRIPTPFKCYMPECISSGEENVNDSEGDRGGAAEHAEPEQTEAAR